MVYGIPPDDQRIQQITLDCEGDCNGKPCQKKRSTRRAADMEISTVWCACEGDPADPAGTCVTGLVHKRRHNSDGTSDEFPSAMTCLNGCGDSSQTCRPVKIGELEVVADRPDHPGEDFHEGLIVPEKRYTYRIERWQCRCVPADLD